MFKKYSFFSKYDLRSAIVAVKTQSYVLDQLYNDNETNIMYIRQSVKTPVAMDSVCRIHGEAPSKKIAFDKADGTKDEVNFNK